MLVTTGRKRQDAHVDDVAAVITVNCVDGPCQGLQQIDVDSGRIIDRATGQPTPYVYEIGDRSTAAHIDAYYWGTDDSDQSADPQ